MDVFLFGTSLSLSAYLPQFLFDSKTERATMFLAMGLSLSLFSLTILEAVPKGTLVLLSEGNFSMAYWVLLWLLSIHVLVVLPSLAGAAVAETFGALLQSNHYGKEDRKYPLYPWRHLPWWIRFTHGFFRILFRNLCHCCHLGFDYFARPAGPVEASTLVMTIHDEEMANIGASGSTETCSSARSSKRVSVSVSPRSITSNSSHNENSAIHHQSKHTPKLRLLMMLGGLGGIISVFFTLSWLGPLIVQPSLVPKDGVATTTMLSVIVSRICAFGLLISSLLNGFGSVSLPYTHLAGLFLKPVRPESLAKLGGELRSMQEAMAKKRASLRELSVEISVAPRLSGMQINRSSGNASSNISFGFAKSTQNGFSELGDDLKNRRQILQTEIDFLEDLVKETHLDIEELKYSQTVAAAARTEMGRLKSWVGVVFSILLLVRLLNAGYSILSTSHRLINTEILHKRVHSDVVTTALLWLTGRKYVSHKRSAMISQMVSLILTAVLSFTQVRTFLRTITIVNRRLLRFYNKCYCGKVGVSSGSSNIVGSKSISLSVYNSSSSIGDMERGPVTFHSQLIAGLLGSYSLACIVLIKMMLPDEFSAAFSTALGETDIFTLHTYIINLVFFSSAGISTAILTMLLGIQRQNILRHTATLGSSDKTYFGPDV